jgi:adenosylcobinamide-GDP ribazoletransferase
MVVLTGAIHLDGLADSADGYGGQTRERVIEIMHDHSLGTYGVVAVVAALAIRMLAVSTLLGSSRGLLVLISAGAISRSAVGAMSTVLPYVSGGEAGKRLGSLVARGSVPRAAVSVALAAAVSVLLLGAYLAVALLATGALVAGLWMLHCARRLRGYTGDLLGAMSELVEVACLVVAVGFLSR